MRFQNPTPECLSHVFGITQVCSTQLFSTRVGFHSAILQIDVIQCRCLPQVCFLHIRADVFFTGLLLCRYVPHRYFFIRDSPSESPRQECLIPGVSITRVSPHLCDPTDVPVIQVKIYVCTCALPPLFTPPHYRIEFPLQVRPGRGPASCLAPPSHLGSGAQAGSALLSQVSD